MHFVHFHSYFSTLYITAKQHKTTLLMCNTVPPLTLFNTWFHPVCRVEELMGGVSPARSSHGLSLISEINRKQMVLGDNSAERSRSARLHTLTLNWKSLFNLHWAWWENRHMRQIKSVEPCHQPFFSSSDIKIKQHPAILKVLFARFLVSFAISL